MLKIEGSQTAGNQGYVKKIDEFKNLKLSIYGYLKSNPEEIKKEKEEMEMLYVKTMTGSKKFTIMPEMKG